MMEKSRLNTPPQKGRPSTTVPVHAARSLRKRMTAQEVKLWKALRASRPQGFHFRRQVPIDSYVVDFACLRHRLVVEVDGGGHTLPQNVTRDENRDRRLSSDGIAVLRFWNGEIDENLDGVIETILARVPKARL